MGFSKTGQEKRCTAIHHTDGRWQMIPVVSKIACAVIVGIASAGLTMGFILGSLCLSDDEYGKAIAIYILCAMIIVMLCMTAAGATPKVIARIDDPTVEIFQDWSVTTINEDGTVILTKR